MIVAVETVIDPVVPLDALFETGEAVSWSRRLNENWAYKRGRETIQLDLKTDN
jgi:hypothetical protein